MASFRTNHKNKICTILGIIILLLLGGLWWINLITLKETFDLFDNSFTALGKKTWEAGGKVVDYVDDNTDYIALSYKEEQMLEDQMYANLGNVANMRNQQDNISYLQSKTDPSIIDKINIAAFNPTVFSNDRTINVGNPNFTGLNHLSLNGANYSLADITTDILNNNTDSQIKWDEVYVDTANIKNNKLNVIKLPINRPNIIDDACSSKGFLNSNFKEDICTTYAGNPSAINEKCQELTADNCKIPSCCVLINGNNCAAGNIHGPNFLTENGQSVDYTYYYYKNKCYGTGCDMAKKYEAACNNYANNSTGVSKRCMIQMFNIHGCPNSSPDEIINDAMVQSHNLSSKQFVNNYIKTAVGILKHEIDQSNNSVNRKLCYGDISNNTISKTDAVKPPKPAENLEDVGNAVISTMTTFLKIR